MNKTSQAPCPFRTRANKLWKRKAAWIQGRGQFALLAHCRVLTVTLWKTKEDAEKNKRVIDETCCGGRCYRDHEIVDLADLSYRYQRHDSTHGY